MGESSSEEVVVTTIQFMCCTQIMDFEPVFDDEGFLVCPIHNQRRYGWRSPLLKQHKSHPFDPQKPQYVSRPDHSGSLLERDQTFVRELFPEKEQNEIKTE